MCRCCHWCRPRIRILLLHCQGGDISEKQWSFGRVRGSPWSGMGVPGGQKTRPGGLVGAQGQNAGNVGASPPDRDDQLFGCTPLRPPVYSTPEVRGNADTTLVGEVDMSLTQGVLI